MADIKRFTEQLDELIANVEGMGPEPSSTQVRILTNRLESAIERIAPPGSVYGRQLAKVHKVPGTDRWRLAAVEGVAIGLNEDIKAGWFESVVELVHADTYSDYLEMADGLLSQGYKDAAAVIAGTSLEVHVRALCVKHGVDIVLPNGSAKKADTMNADLKKVGVYDGLRQKQLTAWMDLRNKAAHGNYGDYDHAQVGLFISGVREFMLKYPA
ncbi:hypothetical protein [Streptomyces sp. NBC_00623]|uniref:hypothetical protein n=1 Tax=Streptomyces sp. NBC_00623 TaxID=2975790 RepID=UPI0030DE86B5